MRHATFVTLVLFDRILLCEIRCSTHNLARPPRVNLARVVKRETSQRRL